MATKVINIKQAPSGWKDSPDYLYIGRWNSYHGLDKSPWHNPIKLEKDTIERREHCLRQYTRYLMRNMSLLSSLEELAGKTLVCYYAPKLCHGHVLATLADRAIWEGQLNIQQPLLGESSIELPDIDEIGSMIAVCVDRIRRAYSGYGDIAHEYEYAKSLLSSTSKAYTIAKKLTGGYEVRRVVMKSRQNYEKSLARKVRLGGELIGARSIESRMRDLIRHELHKWKYLYSERMIK